MTPAEFKRARETLALSANAMARALGISDGRLIRRYESGEYPVSGPAARLVTLWLAHPDLRPRPAKAP